MIKSILVLSTLLLCNVSYSQKTDSAQYILNSVTLSAGYIEIAPSFDYYTIINQNFANSFPSNEIHTYTKTKYVPLSNYKNIGISFSKKSNNNTSYYSSNEIGIQLYTINTEKLEYSRYSNKLENIKLDWYYYESNNTTYSLSEKYDIVSVSYNKLHSVPLGNFLRIGLGYGTTVGHSYSSKAELETKIRYQPFQTKEPSKIDTTYNNITKVNSTDIETAKTNSSITLLQVVAPIHIEYKMSNKKRLNSIRLFYEIAPCVSFMYHNKNIVFTNNLRQEIGIKYAFMN